MVPPYIHRLWILDSMLPITILYQLQHYSNTNTNQSTTGPSYYIHVLVSLCSLYKSVLILLTAAVNAMNLI